MATVGVAELARNIVVLGDEESGVISRGRVFVKQLIHRDRKNHSGCSKSRALAAQRGLQIRHKQIGSDAFAGYVRRYQAEPSAAEIKKAVIVPTDGPSRMANPRVDKCSHLRLALGNKRAWACLAIAKSCTAWRSACNLAAWAPRSASKVRVASSNSITENLFPSTSSKTAYLARPLPQEGCMGGSGKQIPCLDHSWNRLRTSSVRKLIPAVWPMRWCSGDPSGGTTMVIPVKPVPAVLD